MRQSGEQLLLSAPEIVAAVRSLYDDSLKVYGRVLLKRLRERAAAKEARRQLLPEDAVDPETMPRVNPRHLQKLCQTCKQLQVVPEDGREYSVTLVGQPDRFIDVCSSIDLYPDHLWAALSAYLDFVGADEMALPGGRYACARVLVSRGLALFKGYSLGQICHIVQLAISQRRLLGYRDGCLCPYKYSEGWVKEQCAVAQAPTGQESCPVVSWEEARVLLRQLLSSHRQSENGGISISNLKRLFRLDFQRELSQTVLGHIRLLDLLNDPHLQDICTLHAQPNGQVLVQGIEASPAAWFSVTPHGVWEHWVPLVSVPGMTFAPVPEQTFAPLPREDKMSMVASVCSESTAGDIAEFDLSSDMDGSDFSSSLRQESDDEDNGRPWAVNVKNTFIDVCSPSASSRHRRRSVPALMGAQPVR